MACTLPPIAPTTRWSHAWQRVSLFFQGVYELARHLARRGREVWRTNDRVIDASARVLSRPLPFLVGAAAVFTFLVMIAGATSSSLDDEATTALGAVSQDAAGVAKLNASLAALPRCK